MKDNGGRENGAFYSFIMRMVDRRGSQTDDEAVTHGCRFPDRTRTGEEICVRKGVTALQLSTTKLGNEPSRSLGLLPNKIYIRILKGRLFFFTLPYIILSTLPLSRFSTHDYAPRFGKDLIYRRSPRCFEISHSPFFRIYIFRNLI